MPIFATELTREGGNSPLIKKEIIGRAPSGFDKVVNLNFTR